MKKLSVLVMVVVMLCVMASCVGSDGEQNVITQSDVPVEQTITATVGENARKAYEAYLATFDENYPISSALVIDIDENGVPEVVFSYGEMNHDMYIMSYGENDGLFVYSPLFHSSNSGELYFSADSSIIYCTDSGHNQGTASYHEAACFSVTNEGLKKLAFLSGDEWTDVSEEIWENDELFWEVDAKYDKVFNDAVLSVVGEADYTAYSKACVVDDAEEYLNLELNIDISAKRLEYNRYCDKAMKSALEAANGLSVVEFYCSDFDRNGTYEAFAIVGEETVISSYNVIDGSVLFINSDSQAEIIETAAFNLENSVFSCAYNDYFYCVRQEGKELLPRLTFVNGKEYEVLLNPEFREVEWFESAYHNMDTNLILATECAYKSVVDNLGDTDGVLKSSQKYFLYDTPSGLKEYGAKSVDRDYFVALGGEKYLETIEKSGYEIADILYRENGIVTVNYYKKQEDNRYATYYINFKVTNTSVVPLDDDLYISSDILNEDNIDYRGHYLPELFEDIATYPDN